MNGVFGELLAFAGEGLRVTLSLVVLRAFPVVAALCAFPSTSAAKRAAALALYTALAHAAVTYAGLDAAALALVYVYFLLSSPLLYLAFNRSRRPSRLALGLSAFGLFLLVPASFGESPKLTALVLGWDLMLSAYSYLVDRRQPSSLLDYAFFLFVDPTLARAHRSALGERSAMATAGLLRAAAGALGILASESLIPFAQEVAFPGGSYLLDSAFLLCRMYLAHTGLASLQIGLCRQIGLAVPERYVQPYLATSPADFWQRWNTFIGVWIRVHVFFPTARSLRRRGRALRLAVPIVVSFLVVGILHDAMDTLVHRQLRYQNVLWFLLNAALLLGWEAARERRIAPGNDASSRAIVATLAVALVGARAYF